MPKQEQIDAVLRRADETHEMLQNQRVQADHQRAMADF
jgi:hypothetical protein